MSCHGKAIANTLFFFFKKKEHTEESSKSSKRIKNIIKIMSRPKVFDDSLTAGACYRY